MKNVVRGFVALWYLLGWISHIYLGLFSPETYRVFGETALFPFIRTLWQLWIFPHITLCALLLAAFEIAVGLLLINKGKWVKYGLAFSICFNLCLVLLGLGAANLSGWSDFLANRLANLVFIAIQLPLLWASFDTSLFNINKRKNGQKTA